MRSLSAYLSLTLLVNDPFCLNGILWGEDFDHFLIEQEEVPPYPIRDADSWLTIVSVGELSFTEPISVPLWTEMDSNMNPILR